METKLRYYNETTMDNIIVATLHFNEETKETKLDTSFLAIEHIEVFDHNIDKEFFVEIVFSIKEEIERLKTLGDVRRYIVQYVNVLRFDKIDVER